MRESLKLIFNLIIITLLGLLLIWGMANSAKLKDGLSGANLYTQEDLDNAYNDGYNTAFTDKDEYQTLINEFNELNDRIILLENDINDKTSQIAKLEKERDDLQLEVDNLETSGNADAQTIANLREEMETKAQAISRLQEECDDLKNEVESLKSSGSENSQLIPLLQQEIAEKTAEIERLNNLLLNNSTDVTALSDRIKALENTIAYYEEYIANLGTQETVFVTFLFNNEVYEIKEVEKGSCVTIDNPQSSQYIDFNYWEINGNRIDLESTPINENTTIIANITKWYDVKFIVDDQDYSTLIIAENGAISVPQNPTKSNYVFEYWTLNSVPVTSFDNLFVNSNMIFTAKFTRTYEVTFVIRYLNENNELQSEYEKQSVKENGIAAVPTITSSEKLVFKGWYTDLYNASESMTNPNTYVITSDTTFYMAYERFYEYKFIVNDSEHYSTIAQGRTTFTSLNITELSEEQKTNFQGWEDQTSGSFIAKSSLAYDVTESRDTVYKAVLKNTYANESVLYGSWKGIIENGDGTYTYVYVMIDKENPSETKVAFITQVYEPTQSTIQENLKTINTWYVSEHNLHSQLSSVEESTTVIIRNDVIRNTFILTLGHSERNGDRLDLNLPLQKIS